MAPTFAISAATLLCMHTAHATSPGGFPNQLGAKPPRGWRSWGTYGSDVSQEKMEGTMRSLTTKRAMSDGGLKSLADLGYTDVGLDDGWEACGEGVNGSFHDAITLKPIVNTTRFPSLRKMNDAAHAQGLTSSWYLNVDPCKTENKLTVELYGDANEAVFYDFDGVKFDTQPGGKSHNISKWAATLNATGKQMMVENCLDKNPTYLLDDPAHCDFNFYRTGSDASPNFLGVMRDTLYYLVPYLEVMKPVPASRPGCWAYSDMLSIGAPSWSAPRKQEAIENCGEMTLEEERAMFSVHAIVSSPLILSTDLINETEVQRLWPVISNERVLSVNEQWVGEAGRLLKQSSNMFTANATVGMSCEGSPRPYDFPSWVVFSKRLAEPVGAVAVLAINVATSSQTIELSLDELQDAAAARSNSLTGTNVWNGESTGSVTSDAPWFIELPSHTSTFVIFSEVAPIV